MRPTPDAGGPVAAVVVNYNTRDHLKAFLASMEAEQLAATVVVDNGSTDGSRVAAEAAGAYWVSTGANLGYGRAANQGAASRPAQSARYLLICNPDLEVKPGAVAALVSALEADGSMAAVGPRISNRDGSLYPSARTFPDLVDAMGHGLLGMIVPDNPFTRRYRLLDWDHRDAAKVDWISGACLLVRRDAWDAVGGFDPAYFMYMEDVDLCWRLEAAGWKIGYEPAAEVIHTQGVSADQHPYRMLAAHHRSMWRFAWRTAKGPKRTALPLVAVGVIGRFAVAALRRRLAGTTGGRASSPLP